MVANIDREYVRPSVWSKYLQLVQQYPPNNSRSCGGDIEALMVKRAEKRNQALEFGSQTASDWAEAYDRLIGEHQAKWRFADCDRRLEIKRIDALNDIIESEAREYEVKVKKQTEKANRTVIFIGASIMMVGLFIILKR